MKKLLIPSSLVALSLLTSSAVMAHAGHVTDGSVHGALHMEYVIGLLIIGVAAFLVKRMSSK
jgi:hypothetical protein